MQAVHAPCWESALIFPCKFNDRGCTHGLFSCTVYAECSLHRWRFLTYKRYYTCCMYCRDIGACNCRCTVRAEDDEEAFLSKFDDIIELFYQAAEEQVLEEKNIVDYHNISLTQSELIELNNTIKSKIEEIVHKRKSEDEELQYDIVMVSIPVQKKETCNL